MQTTPCQAGWPAPVVFESIQVQVQVQQVQLGSESYTIGTLTADATPVTNSLMLTKPELGLNKSAAGLQPEKSIKTAANQPVLPMGVVSCMVEAADWIKANFDQLKAAGRGVIDFDGERYEVNFNTDSAAEMMTIYRRLQDPAILDKFNTVHATACCESVLRIENYLAQAEKLDFTDSHVRRGCAETIRRDLACLRYEMYFNRNMGFFEGDMLRTKLEAMELDNNLMFEYTDDDQTDGDKKSCCAAFEKSLNALKEHTQALKDGIDERMVYCHQRWEGELLEKCVDVAQLAKAVVFTCKPCSPDKIRDSGAQSMCRTLAKVLNNQFKAELNEREDDGLIGLPMQALPAGIVERQPPIFRPKS